MVDWDRGAYEDTAAELAPAAELVVEQADIAPGQNVLDLGTGTGNAALLAARAGADVTAVDPSPRLLEVARERVRAGTFAVAKAEDLPFDDRTFDRVLSLFAVIFTEDPQQAATEILRVLKPDGKALITAWEPVGAMRDALDILGKATGEAAGSPARDRFPWGDPTKVTELFRDAEVTVDRAQIPFEGPSAEAYIQRFETRHPAGMLFKDVLTRAGTYEDTRARALAVLESANESETALRVTSSYLIFTVARRGAG
jgi:ubiquinone/menaquinone biosynthesis C-methylase UbiE